MSEKKVKIIEKTEHVGITCADEIIERLRFTFAPNGRREFVPRDQVFPLIFRLLFIASTQK